MLVECNCKDPMRHDNNCPMWDLRANSDWSVLQDDLKALLVALGLSDHARSESPHKVMQQAIAEVVALRARTAWQTCETHGRINGAHAWGCPDCVAFLRAEVERLRKARDEHDRNCPGALEALETRLDVTGYRDRA